jgi:hypothetical protein
MCCAPAYINTTHAALCTAVERTHIEAHHAMSFACCLRTEVLDFARAMRHARTLARAQTTTFKATMLADKARPLALHVFMQLLPSSARWPADIQP